MRRVVTIVLLFVAFVAMADERGELRLERISRHYSSLGNYGLSFVLRVGGAEQSGEIAVDGNNSYMRIADTEIFVADSIRYEVRKSAKEIVVDRADAYERELLNPLNGFSGIKDNYNIEECKVGNSIALRLTPKQTGETIYIITAVDGESISSIRYGMGEGAAELVVQNSRRVPKPLPKFDKECYKGFELIDFR